MELPDAIKLIEKAVKHSDDPQVWADLGAGDGLFSSALSTLLAPKSKICAVDSNRNILAKIKLQSAQVDLVTINENFTSPQLELKNLDGIIMANSLHFVPNKLPVLRSLKNMMKPGGSAVIIEYDMNVPNAWVPYPITMNDLFTLMEKIGFSGIEKIGQRPSVYNSSMMYSLLAIA